MSVKETITDALQAPLDNNVEAADAVKKMLAELKGGSDAKEPEKSYGMLEKTNGASDAKPENGEDVKKTDTKDEDKENDDKHPDRQRREEDDDSPRYRRDRDDRGGQRQRGGRGGRGGGRGGDFKSRNRRENIKSNLVQEEESNDPVAIRKQVLRNPFAPIRLF